MKAVQDMYEDNLTAVKCAVGMTVWFKVEEEEQNAISVGVPPTSDLSR